MNESVSNVPTNYDNGGFISFQPTFMANDDRAERVLNIQRALDYIQERYGCVSNIQTEKEDNPETEAQEG